MQKLFRGSSRGGMTMGGASDAAGTRVRREEQLAAEETGVPTAEARGEIEPGPIGREEVAKAEIILQKYKDGKASLERRIVDNEQWYRLRHWEQIGHSKNPGDPEPASAWLLNCIANKHADAMDNYPAPNVLPREQSDEADAKLLSSVLPAILEACEFEQTYSDVWWYKLKTGTGAYGVFWNPNKQNGLGDIDIRELDLLNLFWEPGIKDIQKSRNLFHVDLFDREVVEAEYPRLKGKLSGATIDTTQYVYDDTVDTADKVAVVDWYYKRRDPGGRTVLHFCKFCGGEVLYASENDPEYRDGGYYDHGKYPVVLDTLFPEAGTPVGFGYVDVCKSPQIFIDKLDQALLKNTVLGARPRFWVRQDGCVNEQEYADASKDFVHYTGSGNPRESMTPIQVPLLNEYAVTMRTLKIDELKETSGNRDFQQGGTSGGITAASAISALQEAGSKLSRDMIKSSYRAHAQIGYLCIDLMRQFYAEERMFRIVGETGRSEYVSFSGRQIGEKPQGDAFGVDMGVRLPVFDIKVSAQKSSPFATVAQNERAKELYGMGFFRPDLADQALAALTIMQFDDIDKVRQKIAENGTLFEKVRQMGGIMTAMAQQLDAMTGSQYLPQVAQLTGQTVEGLSAAPRKHSGASGDVGVNALGDTFNKSRAQTAAAARNDAASKSTPK